MHKLIRILGLGTLILLSLWGCDREQASNHPTLSLTGQTMGTTYSVKVVNPPDTVEADSLRTLVEMTLISVNHHLSNWLPDSEVSRFNADTSRAPMTLSPDLHQVLEESFKIHYLSSGKFDITVSPLVDLWGFGPATASPQKPNDKAISQALEKVGMERHLLFKDNVLQKLHPDVNINLSAIAKGYGVDRVAEALNHVGAINYLVEIGGELLAKGVNSQGEIWRIGIEKPTLAGRTVQYILALEDLAMATSGDYRNYVEREGKRYSHIIEPLTGRPIDHQLASVTVISDSATRADGWATALLVLGDSAGMQLANKQNIAAYFIIRSEDNFTVRRSKRFDELFPVKNTP